MTISEGSLVLYKNHPALVLAVADKLELQLPNADRRRVRGKDVAILHPGPLASLDEVLPEAQGGVDTGWETAWETAWELLAGQQTTLAELSELVHGTFTPATAWATWRSVRDGLLFAGNPDLISAVTPDEVESERRRLAEREAADRAWSRFLDHLQSSQPDPEDEPFLKELEKQALGQPHRSRALGALGRSESPENAHALLLDVGYWDDRRVPYADRHNLPWQPPSQTLERLEKEQRLDLTHLTALAIDDEGSRDPDDALSLEGNRLWVHVADVAALVPPDSAADVEARARGANLYLPDGTVPMLQSQATEQLGLGLGEVSPALSFGVDFHGNQIAGLEIRPSWVRVRRLSYAEADRNLESEPLAGMHHVAQELQGARWADGAVMIEWPEVRIRVDDGLLSVAPVEVTHSRDLVSEAMLAAGAAIARFALEHRIPIPFSTQDPPETVPELDGLAGMFARRRSLKRSVLRTSGGTHSGLGLEAYTQATSPLRRYGDLLVHQQMRAHLKGHPLLTTEEVMERLAVADSVSGYIRQAERLSNRHWTLVYLKERAKACNGWTGTAVVIDKRDRRATVLVEELALETTVHMPADLPLNGKVTLTLGGVDLPRLEPHFQIVSW